MRKAVIAALLAGAGVTAACGQARSQDPGPTVARSFPVGNFTEVEVAGPFDVDIRTGANPGVNARGNDELIEHLIVEVRGDKLEIRPRSERRWFGGWRGNSRGSGTISVTVPMIRAASLAGAGDLRINAVKGDDFEGEIAGSGDLRVDSVEVQSLKLGIAGSGGATARGRARRAEYEIAGSGGVDAQGLEAEDLKVSIAGSGDIKARATKAADVDIMGSGNVEVTGGARCSVSKAGSGNVRCS